MKAEITIVSLGSGDPDLLNIKTLEAIRNAKTLILRTSRHPMSHWLDQNHIPYSSLDHLYDSSEDFNVLDTKIASFLLEQAVQNPVVYAVPDAVQDHSVRALFRTAPEKSLISVIPGVGSSDLYLSESLPYSDDSGITIISAYDFSESGHYDPYHSVLITELDNPLLAGEVKIMLSEILDDEHRIILLNGNTKPCCICLYELDRNQNIDHRTAVFIPSSGFRERHRFVMADLALIMEQLRSPQGCPWDKIQTHQSLRPYLIEEAWECVAAIDENDPDHLCEELGDLLFQVVFHASVGRSFDEFNLTDVLSSICLKMIRRHPHVFSDRQCIDAAGVRTAWDRIKQNETGHVTAIDSLEDVSSGLPALMYASKSLKKLKPVKSFDRSLHQILADMSDLSQKLKNTDTPVNDTDLGRMLMLCSELSLVSDLDAELVLHKAVERLKSRLRIAESKAAKDGKSLEHLTFNELGVYLQYVEGEIE